MSSWPNDPGFDTDYEQTTPVQLTIKGHIPSYAAGVLYRTGPLGYKVETSKGNTWAANHWFDGLSAVHRFQIECPKGGSPRVTYRSRRVVDKMLEIVKRTGKIDGITFGAKRDPCKAFFKKVMSIFVAEREAGNIGVTLSINMPGGGYTPSDEKTSIVNGHSAGIETLHVKTDANVFRRIDPETLEPEGIASQRSLHPDLKGPFSCAHAKSDPNTGDIYNFNLDFGRASTYRIFCTSVSTGKTTILAKFSGTPAYIHSLFLSGNYVVLCVWNSHIAYNGLSVLYHKNVVDAIEPFDPSKKAVWYVVDRRHGKGLVATYESDPFFCFHTINAWDEPSSNNTNETDIICELSLYDNLDLIHRFYYDNLISCGKGHETYVGKKRETCLPSLARFRLSAINSSISPSTHRTAELVYKAPKPLSSELPTMNPAYITRPHRYTYGVADRLKSSFMDGLVKFDSNTQTAVFWETEAHTPGEPIFVGDPEGKEEDNGVLLSVVLDGVNGKSYLLCLDARTMKEKGRAEMEGPMAFGFHGAFKGNGVKYGGDI
ncbi:beta carotene dioxygenase [Lindgomyces ingoldianus]|uniref:Beta carotene dioxygenase n=1 Tax=Lindgomyces ingoldianus TaxID=673940 RepID=A0ACB6QHJ4_9PLEO|nr:beta carotene dioxygenase [Lindgomyces ingoldianus]KAF2466346.1 beta carotene dioxygenase [Lindgomyces ingoldianus]